MNDLDRNVAASLVRMAVQDGVAVIVIDNPPVNALGPGVPEGVIDAVNRAAVEPSIKAIVLMGAGRNFIAGADIRHFGTGMTRPPVGQRAPDLLDQSAKPIVAAIHGYALGGGLEYALACHYRIATAGARVGLPEVLIGAIPGGGGTQRLPRLIGPRAALDMIVSGRHVSAMEAVKLGLLDDLVPEGSDLRAAAVAFAQRIAGLQPLPRVRDMSAKLREAQDDPGLFDAKRQAIAHKARNQQVPYAAIAAVEASCALPFADGLRHERHLFETLETTVEARALRYAFFAEREAAKLPDVPAATPAAAIASVAIIGAGTMGAGIAIACADAGLTVKLFDSMPGALAESLTRIRRTYDVAFARGRLSAFEASQRLGRIEAVHSYAAIRDCEVAIEAVYEDLDTKKAVFAELDAAMKPGALLLTSTSGFDIDLIAGTTQRPQNVAGTHFFSPANVTKLLEVVIGSRTAPAALLTTVRLGRRLGKTCVVARTCEGFLTGRSRAPLDTEMVLLLEEGALPEQVDRVLVDFGYAMGPFAASDLAGLDVAQALRARRAPADPGRSALPIAERLVALGRLGQKTGAGWYRYQEGNRTPHPDPVVAQVIRDQQQAAGIKSRTIADGEILHRLLFGAVNECCRVLEEGLVYRASDIDVAWLHGFGFPRYRGGLMFWADGIGAAEIHRQVSAWHKEYGERWAPAPLLAEVARMGTLLHEQTGLPRR
ncbi:MAG: enoyl-CoA hydratase/isomerase family protein [Betaproteobacteria bacterium]|nr:enoyl-CoA hydratase/isomerase family protein [Betaproteobacteria bacterium]